jgi:hypothetical protein
MTRIRRRTLTCELTAHCNLRCALCDHASPHLEPRFASLEDFSRQLRLLAAVLEVEELLFSGGEVLLHPEFPAFLRVARETGIARGILVLTNGVLLHRMPEEAWRSMDELQVSVYPGVRIRADLAESARIARENGVSFSARLVEEFQLSLLDEPLADPDLRERIFRACSASVNCHTLYEGRYYRCSRAHHLEERTRLAGAPVRNEGDGLPVESSEDLRGDLERYLAEERPLEACSYCLGTSGRRLPQHQLDARALRGEPGLRHGDPRELVSPEILDLPLSEIPRPRPRTTGWRRYLEEGEGAPG